MGWFDDGSDDDDGDEDPKKSSFSRSGRATKLLLLEHLDDDADDDDEVPAARRNGVDSAQEKERYGDDNDEVDPLDAYMSSLQGQQVIAAASGAASADEQEEEATEEEDGDFDGGGGRSRKNRGGRLDWDGEDEATEHWYRKQRPSKNGLRQQRDEEEEEGEAIIMRKTQQQQQQEQKSSTATSSSTALDSYFHKADHHRSDNRAANGEQKQQQQWWERNEDGRSADAADGNRQPRMSFWTAADTAAGREWRRSNLVTCQPGAIDPIFALEELRDAFGASLLRECRERGLASPTLVQQQTLPAALSGRDCLVTAPTGQGKTLAFAWPLVVHVAAAIEKEFSGTEAPADPGILGPSALVLCPTRELALQVHKQIQPMLRAATSSRAKSKVVIGGQGRYVLWQELQKLGRVDVVVATPGRLLDVLVSTTTKAGSSKSRRGLTLERTSFCVLDEADKMLAMGFEQQVRQILSRIGIRNRQTMLLSATMSRRIESVAREWLCASNVRIAVGVTGQASAHVQQHVMVLPNIEAKQNFLLEMLPTFEQVGRTIVFVATRTGCEVLAAAVRSKVSRVETLHGDRHQSDRNRAVKALKDGTVSILIATDVAARGLDIPHVSTVVNCDAAKCLDSHCHRVGRAGRLSNGQQETGSAYTLLTPKDAGFARLLLTAWEREGREIPTDLRELGGRNRASSSARGLSQSHRSGLGYERAVHGGGDAPPQKRSRWS